MKKQLKTKMEVIGTPLSKKELKQILGGDITVNKAKTAATTDTTLLDYMTPN